MNWLRSLGLIGIVCLVVGCGRTVVTNKAEAQEQRLARETLIMALEAWKAGKVPALKAQERSIRFVDDDQKAGWKLVSFEPPDPKEPILPNKDVKVSIVVEKNRDKPVEKTVTYQIGLIPGLTVLRSDN